MAYNWKNVGELWSGELQNMENTACKRSNRLKKKMQMHSSDRLRCHDSEKMYEHINFEIFENCFTRK